MRLFPERSRAALQAWLLLAIALPLSGCASRLHTGDPCQFGSPAQSVTLYFGLATTAGAEVGESAWKGFEGAALQPLFPRGFTAYRGHGTWKDPRTGTVSHDPTSIVRAVIPPTESAGAIARAAATAYKRFNGSQSAIGVEISRACADFDVRAAE